MKQLLIAIAIISLLSGCSLLKVKPYDPIPLKATKVVGRIVVAVPTLSLSESLYYAHHRLKDNCDQDVASWLGANIDQLRLAYGDNYTRVSDTHGEGALVHYTWEVQFSSPGQWDSIHGNVVSSGTWTPPMVRSFTFIRTFHLNANGIVDAYKWQGAQKDEPTRR